MIDTVSITRDAQANYIHSAKKVRSVPPGTPEHAYWLGKREAYLDSWSAMLRYGRRV